MNNQARTLPEQPMNAEQEKQLNELANEAHKNINWQELSKLIPTRELDPSNAERLQQTAFHSESLVEPLDIHQADNIIRQMQNNLAWTLKRNDVEELMMCQPVVRDVAVRDLYSHAKTSGVEPIGHTEEGGPVFLVTMSREQHVNWVNTGVSQQTVQTPFGERASYGGLCVILDLQSRRYTDDKEVPFYAEKDGAVVVNHDYLLTTHEDITLFHPNALCRESIGGGIIDPQAIKYVNEQSLFRAILKYRWVRENPHNAKIIRIRRCPLSP